MAGRKIEIEYLKLPADPKELLNLYSLRDRLRIYESLAGNLQSYIEQIFNSFVYKGKDLLEYIPEDHWEQYRFDEGANKFTKKEFIKEFHKSTTKFVINVDKKIITEHPISHFPMRYKLSGDNVKVLFRERNYQWNHRDYNPHYTQWDYEFLINLKDNKMINVYTAKLSVPHSYGSSSSTLYDDD